MSCRQDCNMVQVSEFLVRCASCGSFGPSGGMFQSIPEPTTKRLYKVKTPPENKVLYFGCYSEDHVGHALYEVGLIRNRDTEKISPWHPALLDAKLTPRHPFTKKRDDEQPEGLYTVTHKEGWTAVAFWDRSADSRFGSNSAFLADIRHGTGEQVLELARAAFPTIFARLEKKRVELKPYET